TTVDRELNRSYGLGMELRSVVEALEKIAPTRCAEAWDNVGLLLGDLAQPIERAIATIDYTAAVALEAKRADCQLVIAYHPPIFAPMKRIDPSSVIHDAMRRGI